MTELQVATLLTILNKANPLNTVDEDKVAVWWQALGQEAPDMDGEWAIRWATRWAAQNEGVLLIAHLLRAWHDYSRLRRERALAGEMGPVRQTMPDWFAAAMHDAQKGVKDPRTGEPVPTGDIYAQALGAASRLNVTDIGGGLDAHCGNPECRCVHRLPCYRGWLEDASETAVVPCRTCRESLHDTLAALPPPGHRREVDFAILRGRTRADSDHRREAS